MKHTIKKIAFISILTLANVYSGLTIAAQFEQSKPASKLIMVMPSDVKWEKGPAALPAGVELAVLEGNPHKAGIFTMRLKFPANSQVMPHTHPAVERVTVLSGTIHLGLGDKFDKEKTTTITTGSFFALPAGTKHYGWTDEEVVLQLTGIGPWNANYIDTKHDPRKKAG
jgi:quercetin dioxygenase-like cupin family protein